MIFRKSCPLFFKLPRIVFKVVKRVVGVGDAVFELFNEDQDEEVEHDEGHEQDEEYHVDISDKRTTTFSLNTVITLIRDIIHNFMSILTSRTPK